MHLYCQTFLQESIFGGALCSLQAGCVMFHWTTEMKDMGWVGQRSISIISQVVPCLEIAIQVIKK